MATVEQSVAVDGLPIHYLSAGEGPPLVLLHGAGDDALDWRWVLPALARTHRGYAPDPPGSDDSAKPVAAYSPAFFERFVASFADALGLGRATFVGNSLGGLVALRLAFSEPARVGALVLVDGAMAALPHLKREGRGALVHVSSMGAKRSIPLQSAYCASKHGIDGFLEALRVELRREGAPVSVTQVMPATINTPLFDKARTKLGVRPVAPPPIYQPGGVADAILYAAEHPARDLVVGGAARAVMTGQQISPRLLDALPERFGFEVHYTDEPRTEDDPDNLFEPVLGLDTAEGSFGDRAHPTSLYNRLELRPGLKRTVALGAALGALAILRGRS
jgi:pimeloyl-ACP methyl ester carboxylesterase